MWRRTAVGVVAALVLAAPAHAQRIATGASPHVAIDPAGTAYVTYTVNQDVGASETVHVCAIPVGAPSCVRDVVLPPILIDGQVADGINAFILRRPSDGALVVLAGRALPSAGELYSVWAMQSADAGMTWSAPVQLLSGGAYLDDAELTADGGAVELAFQTGSGGSDELFSRVPLTGPTTGPQINLSARFGNDFAANASVAPQPDGSTIVAMERAVDGGHGLRRLPAGGTVADQAAWTPWKRLRNVPRGHDGDRLATGPSGTWLLTAGGPGRLDQRDATFTIQKVGRQGVGRQRAAGTRQSIHASAFKQDPSGRLHVAYVENTRNHRRIRALRTSRRCWFGRERIVAQGGSRLDPTELDLAVAGPDAAVMTWRQDGTDELHFARFTYPKPPKRCR